MSKLLAKKKVNEDILGAAARIVPETNQGKVDDVVSDADLDTILDDVEKIQANKIQAENKIASAKFTKEDERHLNEIFKDAEKRRIEFEELQDVVSQNVESDDEDQSTIASTSTQSSSQDSDLDKLIDDIEKQGGTNINSKIIPKLNEEMEDEMDKILAEVDGAKKKKIHQPQKAPSKKERRNSSSSESSSSIDSDEECSNSSENELNTLVAELLEV